MKKILIFATLTLFLSIYPRLSFAQIIGGVPVGAGGAMPCTSAQVDTALGCIPTDPQELVKWVLKYAILMGGGIAFLLSVFGGVSIILAGGNPEKINSGKEIIGSALTGLLFIIFSVFLLRFIGYDILQLPGFKP